MTDGQAALMFMPSRLPVYQNLGEKLTDLASCHRGRHCNSDFLLVGSISREGQEK
jgi:hypothetical protein